MHAINFMLIYIFIIFFYSWKCFDVKDFLSQANVFEIDMRIIF
jgi:hypothetical protein